MLRPKYEWFVRAKASISLNSWGKVSVNIITVPDSNCTLPGKPGGPAQLRVLEAAVEDEELAALLQGRPGLRQGARCVASLDDDGRLCKDGHGNVSPGDEQAIATVVLGLMPQDRDLADHQEGLGNGLLESGILPRVNV